MEKIKLLTSNEVCEILGISKSTLYRWNNLQDDELYNNYSDIYNVLKNKTKQNKSKEKFLLHVMSERNEDEIPKDFPRPFKIGRSYKWEQKEIKDWLESKRVK